MLQNKAWMVLASFKQNKFNDRDLSSLISFIHREIHVGYLIDLQLCYIAVIVSFYYDSRRQYRYLES